MILLTLAKFTDDHLQSRLVDLSSGTAILAFDREIDTQSFARVGDLCAIAHHQSHKQPGRQAVELYKLSDGTKCAELPHVSQIEFATAVVFHGGRLVVASNGQGYKSSLFVFRQDTEDAFVLEQRLDLEPEQIRLSGLAADNRGIFFTSYSAQKVFRLRFSDWQIEPLIDVARFGQHMPVGLTLTDDEIIVVGHMDGSIGIYDRKYYLPKRIWRDGFDLPWSALPYENGFLVANVGRPRPYLSSGYLVRLGSCGEVLEYLPMPGAAVMKD